MDQYQIGDVVKVKDEKGTHIIYKIDIVYDEEPPYEFFFEYATDKSAWHNHDELTLVRKADKESIKELIKSLSNH